MDDKLVHTIQLAMVLGAAVLLIIFANKVIDPLAVFTSMIAGIGGIVGTRIASNGYVKAPPTQNVPAPVSVPAQAPAATVTTTMTTGG